MVRGEVFWTIKKNTFTYQEYWNSRTNWITCIDKKLLRNIYTYQFHANDLFLYPLKTSENQRFSDVFRGYRKRLTAWNWLLTIFITYCWKAGKLSELSFRKKYNWSAYICMYLTFQLICQMCLHLDKAIRKSTGLIYWDFAQKIIEIFERWEHCN